MQTGWLQSVLETPGPYASVHLDVTRTDNTADEELRLRWAQVAGQLEAAGAPDALVRRVEDVVRSPTGLPGEQGRTVVATADEVLLDRVLPHRPLRDGGAYGAVPHLLPLVRALADSVPYVLVEVDHAGADVTVVDGTGRPVAEEEVDGGHDVLHKVPGGGWSHRRYQMRAEDSWERNATAVAERLDAVVSRHAPELVLISGEAQARSHVHRHASGRVAERLVDVEGGGRGDGVHEQAFTERVEKVLTDRRQRSLGEAVERYRQEHGRGGAAASGLAGVVDALRQGAVELLLLADDPTSTATLWAGEDALQLGTTEDEVRALGSPTAVRERADAVLLRALVAQKGDVELLERDGLDAGIGALLRFDVRPPVPGR